MNNRFEYEPASEVVKLLQITDPHLFKDTSKDLLGINTHESFSQVLKEIQLEPFEYDVVLATGDLVQDSSDEGYLRFVEMVKPLNKWVFWLSNKITCQCLPRSKCFDALIGDWLKCSTILGWKS